MNEFEELDSYLSEHFGRVNSSQVEQSNPAPPLEATDEFIDDCNDDVVDDTPTCITAFLDRERNSSVDDDDADDPLINPDDLPNAKLRQGCGCGKSCFDHFQTKKIVDHIWDLREMTKQEKEALIMTILSTLGIDSSTTRRGDRKRTVYQYSFNGVRVCRNAFMVIYDLHDFTLRALISHIHENGVVPRVHGNADRKPKNALSFADVQRVVQFLRSFADENGLPQPAAPRGCPDIPPIYLPSSMTKKSVHKSYVESVSGDGGRVVKISAFSEIWKSSVPQICIATPRHDVCAACEKFRKEIMDAVTEEEKMEATRNMHIQAAQREREFYMGNVRDSQADVQAGVDRGNSHYTFDFAQNVTLPHHARQMGPLYFLTLMKVQVFGFRNDGIPHQLIHLFDEGQSIGQDGKLSHGPNAVISMIDHGLGTIGRGEEICSMHADNCAGQNKNRYVMGYLAWRVMTGRHKEIALHMQTPGHSRCLIDAGFAQFKRNYRRSDADRLDDLSEQANRSSHVNEAVVYPAWTWRDWKSFISQHFKALKGIAAYQHFRFRHDQPGVVLLSKTPEGPETEVQLLRDPAHRFTAEDMPAQMEAGGLTRERQLYLYRNVRRYSRSRDQDVTCPQPREE